MKYIFNILLFLVALFFSGCYATQGYPENEDRYPYPGKGKQETKEKRNNNGKYYPLSALKIPKGHLPPPGECKVWLPGRPPGRQPPPQSCGSAFRNAPLGAWVITHEGERYKINIFSAKTRSVVEEVRYYLMK